MTLTFSKVRHGLQGLALSCVYFFILFSVVNVAIYGVQKILSFNTTKEIINIEARELAERWGDESLKEQYPGKSLERIRQTLNDQVVSMPVYKEFVQYAMEETSTKSFNFHKEGFRIDPGFQGQWPPNTADFTDPFKPFNIFVFGGSTTMGGGVEDQDTWPTVFQALVSQSKKKLGLSEKTPVHVYNFGQPAYISAQEVTFLGDLLRRGYVPDLAVFLDGLNDNIIWDGRLAWTPFLKDSSQRLMDYWKKDTLTVQAIRFFKRMPFYQLAQQLAKKDPAPFPSIVGTENIYKDDKKHLAAYHSYKRNREIGRALSKYFGFPAFFIIQPIPYYNYPAEKRVLRLLDAMNPIHRAVLRAKYAYKNYNKEWKSLVDAQGDTFWCGDLQQNESRLIYVDHAHYNSIGNKLVAECVADNIFRAYSQVD